MTFSNTSKSSPWEALQNERGFSPGTGAPSPRDFPPKSDRSAVTMLLRSKVTTLRESFMVAMGGIEAGGRMGWGCVCAKDLALNRSVYRGCWSFGCWGWIGWDGVAGID